MNSLTNPVLSGGTVNFTPSTYTPQTPAQQTTIIFNPPPPFTGAVVNWPMNIQLRQDCIVAAKVAAQATMTINDFVSALVTQNSALLPPPIIQNQPLPITLVHGNPGQSAVTAWLVYQAYPTTGITFQWQLSSNGGTSWTNISNGGVWSGATTYQITFTPTDTSMNGNLIRCLCTGGAGSTTSNSALLTVT